MAMQNEEMLNDLVVESREHLTSIEPDLLELEQKGANVSDELVNRVFRAIHSIKGGFGFFGIEQVTKLSHSMENVMAKVRDKQLAVNPEMVDALLLGVDKLRTLLDDVSHAENISIDEEVNRLQPLLEGAGGPALPKAPGAPAKSSAAMVESGDAEKTMRLKHPLVTDEMIVESIRNGKLIYQITLHAKSDMDAQSMTPIKLFESWERIGDILDVAFDVDIVVGLRGSSSAELAYSVILASVLEADLISAGVGIPQDQIFSFDSTKIKERLLKEIRQAAQSTETKSTMVQVNRMETQADARKSESKIEDALRVKVSLLNNLMNLAGELVLSRNQLLQGVSKPINQAMEGDRIFREFDRAVQVACTQLTETAATNPGQVAIAAENIGSRLKQQFRSSLGFSMADLPGAKSIIQNIDLVTSLLQENIMQTRLQPVSVVFSKFPRIIRDLAKKLDKEVNLTLIGQDVELDKSIIESLSDPLTHLVRNSADHGIEMPDKRAAAGKPAVGEVVLRAFHEGGKVNIEITDDGGGINTQRVKEKAIKLGMVTAEAAEKLSEADINRFIMAPGFSTAEKVSDVSGRGVGMDVVKTNIERLGGTVEIESVYGHGTTIIMKLPLTLAIISSLVVASEGKRFAIPQVNIIELVRIRAMDVTKKIEHVGNSEVYRLRGHLLPLIRLQEVLNIPKTFIHPETGKRLPDKRTRWSDRRGIPAETEEEENIRVPKEIRDRRNGSQDRREAVVNAVKIIVLKSGDHQYGLVVDDVFDSEEIVVKPLSSYLKSTLCYAGCTIMGDGTVAMILDTNGIVRTAGLKFSDLESENKREQQKFEKSQQVQLKDLFLFNNGTQERFAVGLSEVARVEKIEAEKITKVGSKEYLNYDKYSMRLIRLDEYLPVSGVSSSTSDVYIIVPKNMAHPVGIIAAGVEDIIATDYKMETTTVRGTGVQGTAVINKQMTIFVDIPALAHAAEPELFL